MMFCQKTFGIQKLKKNQKRLHAATSVMRCACFKNIKHEPRAFKLIIKILLAETFETVPSPHAGKISGKDFK